MSRRTYGAVVIIALLLPGVWLADGQSITVTVPEQLPVAITGPIEVGMPVLLFAGIPALFIVFMVIESTGHIRERQPPS